MNNKTQSIIAIIFGVIVFIAIGQYVGHNTSKSLCKGAEYDVKNDILYCWSGSEWVKPERLK